MKYSDIGYQNDTINNALQHLYMMNEKFNVHFPSLKENLEYYKNKKECNHLKLKFIFYCIITFLLIINIIAYYNQSLLVFIPFIIIVSLWSIIYYIYNHRIINLPNFLFYLFIINFFSYIIFWLYIPIGNNVFVIIPERIIIALKVFLCVIFSINYFQFSKQIEKEYFFIDILEELEKDNQIEFEQQNEETENELMNEISEPEQGENQEKELKNEIPEAVQEEVLNQSPPEEIKQKDNRSSKKKKSGITVNDDFKNMFASVYSVEEAQLHTYVDFIKIFARRHDEQHPFIGKKNDFIYRNDQIVKLNKLGKVITNYSDATIEQKYSNFCNNSLS